MYSYRVFLISCVDSHFPSKPRAFIVFRLAWSCGDEEMAPWWRALALLSEGPGSISAHTQWLTLSISRASGNPAPSSGCHSHQTHMHFADAHAGKTPTHEVNKQMHFNVKSGEYIALLESVSQRQLFLIYFKMCAAFVDIHNPNGKHENICILFWNIFRSLMCSLPFSVTGTPAVSLLTA